MLKIIAVTYRQTTELEVFLGSLLLQTCPAWSVELIHDGKVPDDVCEVMKKYSLDKRIKFICSKNRVGNWGHKNRNIGLTHIIPCSTDWVLQTNADNYYTPEFVEQVLSAAALENVGIVMTDTVHSHLHYGYHSSRLFEGGLDLGCFIVRSDIAVKTGFTKEHFSADGFYAVECAKECERQGLVAAHISKALFVHN